MNDIELFLFESYLEHLFKLECENELRLEKENDVIQAMKYSVDMNIT